MDLPDRTSNLSALARTRFTPEEAKLPNIESTDTTSERSLSHQGSSSSAKRTTNNEVTKREHLDPANEIQSIMEQFEDTDESILTNEEQKAVSGAKIGNETTFAPPPRFSSLEMQSYAGKQASQHQVASLNEGPSQIAFLSLSGKEPKSEAQNPTQLSPLSASLLNKSLPPAPDPEPDLPFDFHRFLEQLRHRTADPVAKFLRSFLMEFGKKQWMAHEQVKIISDFLAFIAGKMQHCEVWNCVSDAEFDNAKEGMEKLVMSRLYTQTFSPTIPAPPLPSQGKGKRRTGDKQRQHGRRGQHQEDVERDEILAQKFKIYHWVREEHLDLQKVNENGNRFLSLAQQELLKITSYRAPRDKVICVLNCCKVIFGYLRSSKMSDTSADAFIPLLIYVVLRASPEYLVSNTQYILRFRNQEKLGGETGYYISTLLGAVQFIENLDRTSLTISDSEFEKCVEAAVSSMAEKITPTPQSTNAFEVTPRATEKSATRNSSIWQRDTSNVESSDMVADSDDGVEGEDGPAVSNILKTIQKPLSNIGRMFSEDSRKGGDRDLILPRKQAQSKDMGEDELTSTVLETTQSNEHAIREGNCKNKDASKSDIIDNISYGPDSDSLNPSRAQYINIVDQLVSMFPSLDRDLIEDIVQMKDGRVGSAVDACLALNA